MWRKLSEMMLFYNMSLKYRLLLYFLFLVILPTSIISVTIYNESNRTISEQMTTSVQKNLTMAESVLLKKIEEMASMANAIYMNPDMTELLSADRPFDQVAIVNELAQLNKIVSSYDLPLDQNRSLSPRVYMLDRPEYLQYNFSDYVSTISLIEREEWYFDIPPKNKYSIIPMRNLPDQSGNHNSIMLAKRLFGLRNAAIPYVGLLTVESDIREFTRILEQLKPSVNSTIAVLDSSSNIIISPDMKFIDGGHAELADAEAFYRDPLNPFGSMQTKMKGEDVLLSYRTIDALDWTLLTVSPMSDLNGKLVSFRKVMYAVLAICMVVAFIIALLLSGNITHPIRKFIKSMSYAQEGNFDIHIHYKRKDEFTYLFSQYNKMIRQIKELINKLYVSELRKKEAELKALQAQINPHFLYNTLDSINWIALRHRVPDISGMVTSLSDFFRYSLSDGRMIIPIEDELKQVESYLSIQRVRFQERLVYSIDTDPDVYGHETVKLILQPLVENSLIHGIERRRGNGIIHIRARVEENWIRIEVSDNGVGTDVDKLQSMLREENGDSFGLMNVNQRIQQVFGDNAGLRFRTNDGEGMTVIVEFPCRPTKEATHHDQNDYS